MNPIPEPDQLPRVLASLNADRKVCIGHYGKIQPATQNGSLLPSGDPLPLLGELTVPTRPYVVQLEYPAHPSGPAGPVHPKARILHPEMTFDTYPRHPHMNGYPRSDSHPDSDSWPCPVSPHERVWSWRNGGSWLYLAQVALWILKTEVWARTGGGVSKNAIWLGSAAPHTLAYVLRLGQEDPCRCGSGQPFKHCHVSKEIEAAVLRS